ncbi:family 20 glycosylhydrolase [Ferruginibacter sp. HRS2-29]|uniref:glycoside hydrolase family 20 protein n=1 Tax=Ferruginibacter sp. HRS2-29 TaxID=2487334 RepID=UPI0020CB9502|nr:family 20 glycosylhydrolase [Ferruginibacter sp. HRS2-29]MCP9751122.1 beta-N-acetylhexosaminidase [Ferruginibacter sp. HRS2-29]
MKKWLVVLFVIATQNCIAQVNIVPAPAEIKTGSGSFTITAKTIIVLEGSHLENIAAQLVSSVKKLSGISLQIKKNAVKGFPATNIIALNYERLDNELPGAYTLEVNDKQVYIAGDNEEGVFYGVQSLLQLMPAGNKSASVSIPQLSVNDRPRFAYRGAHLDVARHFFPVEDVKKYIDYLATCKLNKFHWHLTDDQGWRIEIKKYPLLTKVGGYRNGTIIGRYPGKGNDSLTYGGYYTQSQIKEVVKYAADQYIEVIPEIEMPGHASAAIAAYPQLSCFPQEDTKVLESTPWAGSRKGKQVQQTWGVFEDVFAPTDYTFNFLQDVIDEILPLFPSKYIHIGGDECPKISWKRSPFCQQLIKDKNLKDEHGLQSYFINRMEKYINQKGKKIIGWDEILEGGLAPNATVMSWRGEAGGIAAAKENHDVIMTPEAYCYLDHSQSRNEDSITIGNYLPLEKVYSYEPVAAVLTEAQQKHITGAQVNLWTEYIGNRQKLEYHLFPRMIAMSEVLWSPKEKRNWKDFERRLPVIFERLDAQKINHSNAFYDIKATVLPATDGDGLIWQLETKPMNFKKLWANYPSGKDSVEVYVFDSLGYEAGKRMIQQTKSDFYREKDIVSIPIKFSGSAEAVLCEGKIPFGTEVVYNDRPLSVLTQPFNINAATAKKIKLTTDPAERYPGDGAFTLVNGVQNKMGLVRSSEFLGFNGTDLNAIIDLGKPTFINKIVLHVFEQTNSWIYRPASVSFYSSNDSINFKLLETVTTPSGKANLMYSTKPTEPARFVKVAAKNFGTIPEGRPGAGCKAWLFADEIEVVNSE